MLLITSSRSLSRKFSPEFPYTSFKTTLFSRGNVHATGSPERPVWLVRLCGAKTYVSQLQDRHGVPR